MKLFFLKAQSRIRGRFCLIIPVKSSHNVCPLICYAVCFREKGLHQVWADTILTWSCYYLMSDSCVICVSTSKIWGTRNDFMWLLGHVWKALCIFSTNPYLKHFPTSLDRCSFQLECKWIWRGPTRSVLIITMNITLVQRQSNIRTVQAAVLLKIKQSRHQRVEST